MDLIILTCRHSKGQEHGDGLAKGEWGESWVCEEGTREDR